PALRARRATDANVATHAPALVHLETHGIDVAVHVARGVQLQAARRRDASTHAAADDRVLRLDVTLDHGMRTEHDALRRVHVALQVALDAQRAVHGDVAGDRHAFADERYGCPIARRRSRCRCVDGALFTFPAEHSVLRNP